MTEQSAMDLGAPQARRFNMLELIACAEREVKMRRQVYPHRVAQGRMTKALATRETAMMAAIAVKLREYAQADGWNV